MRKVPAVARAIAIIDLVTRAAEPTKVSAIAAALDIPRNTTYELLATLADGDLVEIGGDGRVTAGFRLFEWGGRYARSINLIEQAQRVAREIAITNKQTVHVASLEGRDVVYLVKEEGREQIRMGSAVGRRVPAHATGVGKALLAQLDLDELDRLLAQAPLVRMTSSTITDPAALCAELQTVRRTGVAFDYEESSREVACVAAVVRDNNGRVVAGLSISTLSSRFDAELRDQLIAAATDGADRLSRRLGWTGHVPDGAGNTSEDTL